MTLQVSDRAPKTSLTEGSDDCVVFVVACSERVIVLKYVQTCSQLLRTEETSIIRQWPQFCARGCMHGTWMRTTTFSNVIAEIAHRRHVQQKAVATVSCLRLLFRFLEKEGVVPSLYSVFPCGWIIWRAVFVIIDGLLRRYRKFIFHFRRQFDEHLRKWFQMNSIFCRLLRSDRVPPANTSVYSMPQLLICFS